MISKSFSQTDTIQKTKYVFLTEAQASKVIKDLINYDALIKISLLQENRINNFLKKIELLNNTIILKDSIILKKNEIIKNQNEIIYNKVKPKFHSFIGIKSNNFNFNNVSIYNRTFLEIYKINTGILSNIPLNTINNSFELSIFVEYKIF